jgi:phosphate transport system substrate-binding protein
MWEPAAQGKIMRWNQVNPAWPDRAMQAVRRGRRLGHVRLLHRSRHRQVKSSRGDFTASEDDNVWCRVSRDVDAMGFFGLCLLRREQGQAQGPADQLEGRQGGCADDANVLNGTYQPLSRPIFIYVNAKSLAKRPEVRSSPSST